MKNFLIILLLIIIFLPATSFAQGPFVPDCGQYNDCGFFALLQMVNDIIKWIIMISFPVAAGVFVWAGFILMTTGVADKRSEAKSILLKVFIGFVCILAAWLIVGTITKALLKNPSIVPVAGAS